MADADATMMQGDGDATSRSDADANGSGDADSAPGTDADAGAGTDADASSSADGEGGSASDAGDASDAAPLLTAQQYPAALATAFCNSVAACCGMNGDAASFNWTSCYTGELSAGFKGASTGVQYFDAGNIVFDPVQGQNCIDVISAIDCVSNQTTSAEQAQLFKSCYATYTGTLEAGAPCSATMECAPGTFCSAAAGGTCTPLVGVGGNCGALGANLNLGQTMCSYRGSASNGLFCQNISGDAGTAALPTAQWTCQAQWEGGSECAGNQDCTTLICHQVSAGFDLCASAGNWANSTTCTFYYVDAGN
jgi:hypothetical protein